jgi:hypothetical protein
VAVRRYVALSFLVQEGQELCCHKLSQDEGGEDEEGEEAVRQEIEEKWEELDEAARGVPYFERFPGPLSSAARQVSTVALCACDVVALVWFVGKKGGLGERRFLPSMFTRVLFFLCEWRIFFGASCKNVVLDHFGSWSKKYRFPASLLKGHQLPSLLGNMAMRIHKPFSLIEMWKVIANSAIGGEKEV